MTEFGRRVGRFVKQLYMLSVMCGRSTYKLTWEEIVAPYLPHWVKVKNPKAPAVKREADEDWGR